MKIKKVTDISKFVEKICSLKQPDSTFYLIDDLSNMQDNIISALREAALRGVFVQIDNIELMQKLKNNVERTLQLKNKTFEYDDDLLKAMELLYRTCPYADFPELELKVSAKLSLDDDSSLISDIDIVSETLIKWEVILGSKFKTNIDSRVSAQLHDAWKKLSTTSKSILDEEKNDIYSYHAMQFTGAVPALNKDKNNFPDQLMSIKRFGAGITHSVTRSGLLHALEGFYDGQYKKLVKIAEASGNPQADDIKVLFKPEMLPLLTVLFRQWPELVRNTVLGKDNPFDLINSSAPECGAWVLQNLAPSEMVTAKIKNEINDDFPNKSLIAVFLYLMSNKYGLNTKRFFQKLNESQKIILREYISDNNYQLLQEMDSNSENFRAINASLFQEGISRSELIQHSSQQMLETILSEMCPISCDKIKPIWDAVSTRQQANIRHILTGFLKNSPDRIDTASFQSAWSNENLFSSDDAKLALLKEADPDLIFMILSEASMMSLQNPSDDKLKGRLKLFVKEFISVYKNSSADKKQQLMSQLFLNELHSENRVLSNIINASRLYNAKVTEPVEAKNTRNIPLSIFRLTYVPKLTKFEKIKNGDEVQLLDAKNKDTYRELVDYDMLVPLFQEVFEPNHIVKLLESTKFPVTLFGAILKTTQTRENLDQYYAKIIKHKSALLGHWFNDFDGRGSDYYYSAYNNYNYGKNKFNTFINLALHNPVCAAWVYDSLFDSELRKNYKDSYGNSKHHFQVQLFSEKTEASKQAVKCNDFFRNWFVYDQIILDRFYDAHQGHLEDRNQYYKNILICRAISTLKEHAKNREVEADNISVRQIEVGPLALLDLKRPFPPKQDNIDVKKLIDSFSIKEIFELIEANDSSTIKDIANNITNDIVVLYWMRAAGNSNRLKGLTNLLQQSTFLNYGRVLSLLIHIEEIKAMSNSLYGDELYKIEDCFAKQVPVELLKYEAEYRVIVANAGQDWDIKITAQSFWSRDFTRVEGTPGEPTCFEKANIEHLQERYVNYVVSLGNSNTAVNALRLRDILTIEKYDPGANEGFFRSIFMSPVDNTPKARIEAAFSSTWDNLCG